MIYSFALVLTVKNEAFMSVVFVTGAVWAQERIELGLDHLDFDVHYLTIFTWQKVMTP